MLVSLIFPKHTLLKGPNFPVIETGPKAEIRPEIAGLTSHESRFSGHFEDFSLYFPENIMRPVGT